MLTFAKLAGNVNIVTMRTVLVQFLELSVVFVFLQLYRALGVFWLEKW